MNIMIVTNSNYFESTRVMLYSLFQSQPEAVKVYLLYHELSDLELEALIRLAKGWPEKEVVPVYLKEFLLEGLLPSKEFPVDIYYRIFGMELLPENLERVLYLDVDMIVKKSLHELYGMNLDGKAMAVCEDIFGYIYGVAQENIRRLGMEEGQRYFNSGVLLINLVYCRKHKVMRRVLEYIYQNPEKLRWMDQDALNVVCGKEAAFVPWQLYNCAPIRYICAVREVQQGIVNPAYGDMLEKEDFPWKEYCDVTEDVYEQAAVIHYMGGTKPWLAQRRQTPIYDIFDRCYKQCIKEMQSRRLIFFTGVYDTLDIFTDELIRAFRELGYETMRFDTGHMEKSLEDLAGFLKSPVKAAITFNNLGFNMELIPGKNIWEELQIPCINILMDHPFCYKEALDASPSNAVVLCTDRNHMKYLQRFYPQIQIVGYLPHGGIQMEGERKIIAERKIDVLYTGGLSRKFAENVMPDFSEFTQFDGKAVALASYEELKIHPHRTTEEVIEEKLAEQGVHPEEAKLCEIISKLHYVDLLATSYYREKVIRILVESGIKVHLYGSGWEDCEWIENPNLIFGGRITAQEAVEKMRDAKIVLNTMTWFKDGTHDRVFNGMLAGAVAMTDTSGYMMEEFCGFCEKGKPDARELVMFGLEQIEELPKTVAGLLSEPEWMQQIADRGFEKAERLHTWKKRAGELEEDLLDGIL